MALISDDEWLDADVGGPWVLDFVDLDVRLRVDGTGPTDDVFVGIARTDDVERYLAGAAYPVVDEIDGRSIRSRQEPRDDRAIGTPTELDIRVTSTSGSGEQELTWEGRGGRWSVVVMNADASPASTPTSRSAPAPTPSPRSP